MDNWVTLILINIVLALMVSIFGNFATGWVKSSYERNVFSSRNKKIKRLIREYHKKKQLNENPNLVVPIALRDFIEDLMTFIVTLASVGTVYLLFAYFTGSWLFFGIAFLVNTGIDGYRTFSKTIDLITDSLWFLSYEKEAKEKIQKLGGNPEDLDKEEG